MKQKCVENIVKEAFCNNQLLTSKSTIEVSSYEKNNWQISFISEFKYHCLFSFNTLSKIGCNQNYSAWPLKREGIGTKMVHATEEVYKKNGIDLIIIRQNAAPLFWKKLGYKEINNNLLEQENKRINPPLQPYQNPHLYKIL